MQRSTTKGLPFYWRVTRQVSLLFVNYFLGPLKMALLLGYVVSLVSTFILAVAFLCAMANWTGTSTHQGHQYAAQHKISNKESLSKHHEHRIAQRVEKKGSGAMTADAAE